MLGCTTGVVWLNDHLYIFKSTDAESAQEQARILNEKRVFLLPGQRKEAEEKKVQFPAVWPENEYVGLGVSRNVLGWGEWMQFAGGISTTMGFGAASARTVNEEGSRTDWQTDHSIRQGSLELDSLGEAFNRVKDAAKKIDLYTNYLYCTKDNAVAVSIKGEKTLDEWLGPEKKFMVRANHYEVLGGWNELKAEEESVHRYQVAYNRLGRMRSVKELKEMLSIKPFNTYSVCSFIGCIQTGEFWYCLEKPERPRQFIKTQLQKA